MAVFVRQNARMLRQLLKKRVKTMIESILLAHRRLATRLFTILISRSLNRCGKGARVCPPFRFSKLDCLSIGDGAIVHRDCWFNAVSENGGTVPPSIIIHRDAQIGQGTSIAAASRVEIGECVLMARNVCIMDHGHAFEDVSTPIMYQGITQARPVHIGDRTWLGQNVFVLPGVTIGRHCVVGANSVVRSDIPDFSVAVGSPARVVKQFDHAAKRWVKVA